VVAITLAAGTADAHVAPSVDDNNRYLKLTPLGDRVRFAYTVFFGEVPGAAERPTIDTNHDGQIDEAEGRAFGDKLGAEVAAALDVEVDGKALRLRWEIVDVGMGTPSVHAGTFSVDLVVWLCLPTPRGAHRVTIHDRFRMPRLGETEVMFEDAPGITIDRAHVGPADDPSFDYRFVGPGGPLQDDGLELAFTAGPKSQVTADGTCVGTPNAAASSSGGKWRMLIYALVPFLVIVAIAIVIVRRRRRAIS
jgi:hypothetical protein